MELIVVIAVIAILASFFLASLARSKSKAKAIACHNNLRQLGIAMATYVQEERHYPAETAPTSATGWMAFGGNWRESVALMNCPGIPGGRWGPVYRPNWFGSGGPEFSPCLGLAADPQKGPLKESEIRAPAEMLALMDPVISMFPPKAPHYGPIVEPPHNQGVQALVCDGHVERLPASKMKSPDDSLRRRWNSDHEPHNETWK